MPNVFLAQPDLLSVETVVESVRTLDDGSPAIVGAINPVRPAGGGQPADRGEVVFNNERIPIERVIKSGGQTWLVLGRGDFAAGDPITIHVDAARRLRLSQGHSLTHLAMAAIRETVPGYESKGADIEEDGIGIELRFRSAAPLSLETVREIDRKTRSWIARAIPIVVERARSIAEAAVRYPKWRIDPDLNLTGKVRVIVIDGIDANPCSGSHVSSTEEIGPYAITGHHAHVSGVNTIALQKLEAWKYWY